VGLTEHDVAHLDRALELARGVRGGTSPNPNVGCVLVLDGLVVGEGATQPAGGLHAEAVALAACRAPAGATAYVTLEPCGHHGRTPPCADALAAAGVVRVVACAVDPAPWVDGGGFARLREAGVVVDVLDRDHALAVASRKENAPFRTSVTLGRPHCTYKAAMSLDGRTATRTGDARWISSPESRTLVHRWRAESDAVLVGSGTAIGDDATLTARDCDPVPDRQPLRVVADRAARLPLASRLVRSVEEGPVLVLVGAGADPGRRSALEAAGVETAVAGSAADVLAALHARGVQGVLLEGGATLAGALLAAGLIDRLALFVAPLIVGDPLAPGIFGAALVPESIAGAIVAAGLEPSRSGPDTLLDAWIRIPA
jgi:diaminohydroxyphosphoribosylaminopyrimidine deaminase/5-amino-6-(5-phosphoribosylamino)uracil reductase